MCGLFKHDPILLLWSQSKTNPPRVSYNLFGYTQVSKDQRKPSHKSNGVDSSREARKSVNSSLSFQIKVLTRQFDEKVNSIEWSFSGQLLLADMNVCGCVGVCRVTSIAQDKWHEYLLLVSSALAFEDKIQNGLNKGLIDVCERCYHKCVRPTEVFAVRSDEKKKFEWRCKLGGL